MINSYFTLNLGSIRYIFSGDQLEPGFQAESIDIPHLAARVDLFGHHFTKHLSAQVTYMRPVRIRRLPQRQRRWGEPSDLDGVRRPHAGLGRAAERSPLGVRRRRMGSHEPFRLRDRWQRQRCSPRILAPDCWAPGSPTMRRRTSTSCSARPIRPAGSRSIQPSTRLYTAGLRYHMRPLPADEVEDNRHGFVFPLNVVRLGYTTNLLGYGVNDFFSRHGPDFLGRERGHEARLHARLPAQRVPHEESVRLRSRRERVVLEKRRQPGKSSARSPCIRSSGSFLLRTQPADLYFGYSLAGPTFISQDRA